jgi:membrane protease YdiL (CAAX protease family)
MVVRFDIATALLFAWALVIAPVLAFLGAKRVASGKPLAPKAKRLKRGAMLMALAALCASLASRSNALDFGIRLNELHVSLGVLIAAFMLLAVSRGIKRLKPDQIALRMKLNWPEDAEQFRWVMVVSFAAGVGEELVYRGALFTLLWRLTSSSAIAATVSIVAFGLAHMTYGWRAVLAITYIGAVFQLLYLVTGNLLTTMVLHTIYDIGIFAIVYHRYRRGDFAAALQSIAAPQEQAASATTASR